MFSSRIRIFAAIFLLGLILIGAAVFFMLRQTPEEPTTETQEPTLLKTHEILGTSVEGREIEAYTYGNGDTRLLFVGGMHGGYEWNTVLLAYQLIDYLEDNTETIPASLAVTVIPSANPDGVYKVVGKEGRFTATDVPSGDTSQGRFNANDVDLNRNFDCNWQAEAVWRNTPVSAGSEPFSEPESKILRDFILTQQPAAVVMWHSQANTVYPGECGGNITEETLEIMHAYANAANYLTAETFDAYAVTGTADGWLALQNIPALTVEMQTHTNIEWERNLAGIQALFEYYD